MKNLIITILSFAVIIMAACCLQPETNNNPSNSISKPDVNYNINYTIPNKYENNNLNNNYDYSNFVYITKTGECFHIGNCSHAKKSAGYMSRSNAIKNGYRACYYCCY